MLVGLADDEEVNVFFTDDGEWPFSVEIHRTVDGVVEVECKNAELTAELIKLREEAERSVVVEERYQTALRILETDAGIGEHDLDVVEHSVDPVGTLVRMRTAVGR